MAKAKIVTPSPSSKILVVLLIIVSIAFIIGFGARTFGYIVSPSETLVDKETYQSITLADGSVYYGNISSIGAEYLVLSNAFTDTDKDEDAISLKPVNDLIAGSSGSLNINRSQVLFWENLDATGTVASSIDNKQYLDGE